MCVLFIAFYNNSLIVLIVLKAVRLFKVILLFLLSQEMKLDRLTNNLSPCRGSNQKDLVSNVACCCFPDFPVLSSNIM